MNLAKYIEYSKYAFPSVVGHLPNHSGSKYNRRERKEEFAPPFPASLTELGHLISSDPVPGLRCTLSATLVLRPSDLDWITTPAFQGHQLVDSRLWDLTGSIIM